MSSVIIQESSRGQEVVTGVTSHAAASQSTSHVFHVQLLYIFENIYVANSN